MVWNCILQSRIISDIQSTIYIYIFYKYSQNTITCSQTETYDTQNNSMGLVLHDCTPSSIIY